MGDVGVTEPSDPDLPSVAGGAALKMNLALQSEPAFQKVPPGSSAGPVGASCCEGANG